MNKPALREKLLTSDVLRRAASIISSSRFITVCFTAIGMFLLLSPTNHSIPALAHLANSEPPRDLETDEVLKIKERFFRGSLPPREEAIEAVPKPLPPPPPSHAEKLRSIDYVGWVGDGNEKIALFKSRDGSKSFSLRVGDTYKSLTLASIEQTEVIFKIGSESVILGMYAK